MTFLTDQVLSIVGTSTAPVWGLVTANGIRKFATGVDDPTPLYTDPAAARAAGFADVVAPPLFNASVTRPTPFRAGFLNDGQYGTTAPPGLTHLQTILAGQRWEFVRPTVAGEEISEVFTTKSIVEKQGRTGPMVLVEKEAVMTTRAGEVVERYGSTLILRQAPPPLPPFAGEQRSFGHAEGLPATEWDGETMIKRPDMISLFLFAGATWCVHRIHWDVPYAQQEGLPGPILPGWMTSSYLAQLAQARAPEGQRLHRLEVRYKASVHPGDTLRCSAQATGDPGAGGELALTMVNQDGTENSSATASYVGV